VQVAATRKYGFDLYVPVPFPWLCTPTLTGAGAAVALGSLEAAGGLLGLLEILLARAPEDDAAGHAPHRERDVELMGDAQEIVFGSPGIPVITGQNSLSRHAKPLEILC